MEKENEFIVVERRDDYVCDLCVLTKEEYAQSIRAGYSPYRSLEREMVFDNKKEAEICASKMLAHSFAFRLMYFSQIPKSELREIIQKEIDAVISDWEGNVGCSA